MPTRYSEQRLKFILSKLNTTINGFEILALDGQPDKNLNCKVKTRHRCGRIGSHYFNNVYQKNAGCPNCPKPKSYKYGPAYNTSNSYFYKCWKNVTKHKDAPEFELLTDFVHWLKLVLKKRFSPDLKNCLGFKKKDKAKPHGFQNSIVVHRVGLIKTEHSL